MSNMNGTPFIDRESLVESLAGGGVCAGARSDRVELGEGLEADALACAAAKGVTAQPLRQFTLAARRCGAQKVLRAMFGDRRRLAQNLADLQNLHFDVRKRPDAPPVAHPRERGPGDASNAASARPWQVSAAGEWWSVIINHDAVSLKLRIKAAVR